MHLRKSGYAEDAEHPRRTQRRLWGDSAYAAFPFFKVVLCETPSRPSIDRSSSNKGQ